MQVEYEEPRQPTTFATSSVLPPKPASEAQSDDDEPEADVDEDEEQEGEEEDDEEEEQVGKSTSDLASAVLLRLDWADPRWLEEQDNEEGGQSTEKTKTKRVAKQRQSLAEKQPGTTIFPIARIKRICKADKDLDMMTSEATFMVAVATVRVPYPNTATRCVSCAAAACSYWSSGTVWTTQVGQWPRLCLTTRRVQQYGQNADEPTRSTLSNISWRRDTRKHDSINVNWSRTRIWVSIFTIISASGTDGGS